MDGQTCWIAQGFPFHLKGLVVSAYRIDHHTTAGRAREAFMFLFNRRLIIRGLDSSLLQDQDPLTCARRPGEGFGTAVQLHDGMTPEEALLLLRAVLGLQVDTIHTLTNPLPSVEVRRHFNPPGYSQTG